VTPSLPKSPARGRRVEGLDVLRGLAAFAIVFFHMRVPLWIGWHAIAGNPDYSVVDRALAWLSLPMTLFGTTVMLFFVVSGFAIHYPYAAPEARVEWGAYAVRRCFRIYPPYAVAVLLTIAAERLAATLIGTPLSHPGTVAASLAMTQNYVPPAGQLIGNPSLWSLPVEVELYIMYPVLLWMWRRAGLAATLIIVAATSAAAAGALAFGHDWPMGNFAKYWIIWVSGAVLAELTRANRLPRWRTSYSFALPAGVGLAIAARSGGLAFGFEHFLWGGIYFLLVLWVLHHPAFLARLPAHVTAALLWLGKISYSLYLVHFPLLLVLGAGWIAAFGQKPSNLLVSIAGSLATLPAAYLLWRFVERPAHEMARTLVDDGRATMPQTVVIETIIASGVNDPRGSSGLKALPGDIAGR
jgi:peptidoglycan/LPS O-acetylase OafA/YrhL